MFVLNKKTWYSWIGKFNNSAVGVNAYVLVCLTGEDVSDVRISISNDPSIIEHPYTHLPNDILDQMKEAIGTDLTTFLTKTLEMRHIHFEELNRKSKSRANGIPLSDLEVRKCIMLTRPNPNNKHIQEYTALWFEANDV